LAEIDELIRLADELMAHPIRYQEACRHKILATLFFEPSTRTRLSFESAILSLGGQVIGFSEASASSTAKGESVGDTVAIVSNYADIIVMRHPKEGAPIVGASRSTVPLINAGDGGHYHPTQTLTDLLTIHHEKGRLDNMTIGFCGDLKYGRTVHSLIGAMARYPGIRFVLISPEELELPKFVKQEYIEKNQIPYQESRSLEDVIGDLDILYMTRIQKERFAEEAEYERLKDSYILTPEKMQKAKEDMCVLHPLPRVNEIDPRVDADPRSAYFRQARYGRFIRMALILKLLGWQLGWRNREETKKIVQAPGYVCRNPHCITTTERGLAQAFTAVQNGESIEYRCAYCEAEAEPVEGEEKDNQKD
jgi:aspartate carbamoyltransferase catalytic subunit